MSDLFDARHAGRFSWQPTRAAALDRLKAYMPSAGADYAKRRNFDFGPDKRNNVSMLSPWVRHRLVSEEDVLRAVLERHSLKGAEKFVQEVFWRGYFKGWLEQRPDVWQEYRVSVSDLFSRLEKDQSLEARYSEAITGKTGIDCFDFWSNELVETGYLHNHARMWFASIWNYTLELPWELGADFFYRHLLDGDPASNTCSWRWVCGLHTIGKTYLARASNIETYTAGRFDPEGVLATCAPSLGGEQGLPDRQVLSFQSPDYSGHRVGLLITEEDCLVDNALFHEKPKTVLALTKPAARSLKKMGALAEAFSSGVVKEAAGIASLTFNVDVEQTASDDWQSVIEDWCKRHDLDGVITPRLTIGPVKQKLHRAFKTIDVPLIEETNVYDQAVWPYAKAGFFGLKKKIPSVLAELGINPDTQGSLRLT